MKNILWILIFSYLTINNSVVQLIRSNVQLRTSKKVYKYTHLTALLSIIVPVIIFSYHIEPLINNESKNYTYIIGTLGLLYAFLLYDEISKKTIVKNGDFNPPKSVYKNKKRRLNLLLTTLLIYVGFNALYYYLTKQIHINLIIPSSLGFIFLLISYIRYNSCVYNFPISWNV